jgi:1-acyl-sn-glycerol-3-phosphate acyltransferase
LGTDNVPKDRPIILISNHNNQFLDGAIQNYVFSKEFHTKFIVATKAMTMPVVKQCLDALGCVKIDRPQDKVEWNKDATIEEFLNQLPNDDDQDGEGESKLN